MKAPLSCSAFLFRQLCTRGKAPAKRPRNAPLRGPNLSAQLSLVNLFLCEIFPKPFIPSLSSGSWNAEKKTTFFLFLFFFAPSRMWLLCVGRGWAKEKKPQSVRRSTYTWGSEGPQRHGAALGGQGWHRAPGMPADQGVCGGGLWSSAWDLARETPHWLFPWQHHSLAGMESLVG